MLICAYGALVKEPLLSAHEMLNVHPSLLPRWRGAAPIERAIEAGDEETGVTIMRPTAELDAGPICLQRSEPIAARRRLRQPGRAAGGARGELLVEALDTQPPFRDQPDQGVTYAEKIEPRGPAGSTRPARRPSSSGACAPSRRTSARTWSSTAASGSASAALRWPPGSTTCHPGELAERDGRSSTGPARARWS